MNEYKKLQVWDFIKQNLAKITDWKARKNIHDTLLLKAKNEWGFNPENVSEHVEPDPECFFADWEKEFVQDIHDSIIFGFDVGAEKRAQENKRALSKMKNYIVQGGTYETLPENLQNKTIRKLYLDALLSIADDNISIADDFIKRTETKGVRQ